MDFGEWLGAALGLGKTGPLESPKGLCDWPRSFIDCEGLLRWTRVSLGTQVLWHHERVSNLLLKPAEAQN